MLSEVKFSQYLSELSTIHHSAIKLATRAFRTSPVISLLFESVQSLLHLRREYFILNTCIFLRSSAFQTFFVLLQDFIFTYHL